MSKQFLKVVKLLHRLDAQEVVKVITLAGMCLNEHLTDLTAGLENQSEEESAGSRPNRALTSNKDEPDAPTPTKNQLDLELLTHRLQDPRLSENERKEIIDEITMILQSPSLLGSDL